MDDNSWRAAQAAREPVVEGMTHSGLPRRMPQANLVPGAAVESSTTFVPGIFAGLSRDPQDVRNRLASFVQGLEQARTAGDAQLPAVPPNPMRAPSPLAAPPGQASLPNKPAPQARHRRREAPVAEPQPAVQHPPIDADQGGVENPWGDGWKTFRPGA